MKLTQSQKIDVTKIIAFGLKKNIENAIEKSYSNVLMKKLHSAADTVFSPPKKRDLSKIPSAPKFKDYFAKCTNERANVIKKLLLGSTHKIKNILRIVCDFEEHCITNGYLSEKDILQAFQGGCLDVLSVAIQNEDVYKKSPSESLSFAILLLSCTRIGLNKSQFSEVVQSVSLRSNLTVASIRRSKCYPLLKRNTIQDLQLS